MEPIPVTPKLVPRISCPAHPVARLEATVQVTGDISDMPFSSGVSSLLWPPALAFSLVSTTRPRRPLLTLHPTTCLVLSCSRCLALVCTLP